MSLVTAQGTATTSLSGGNDLTSIAAQLGISTATNATVSVGFNCATQQTGQSNTFIGYNAASSSLTGNGDTVLGYNAAPILSGDNNVLVGTQAAVGIGAAFGNVAVGAGVAPSLSHGGSNVLLGALANARDGS